MARAADARALDATSLEAAPIQSGKVVREVAGVWGPSLIAAVHNLAARLRPSFPSRRDRLATTRLVGQSSPPEELEE